MFYEHNDRHIGNISLRRWDEVAKLMPALLDYLHRAMAKRWPPGTARDVRIVAGGEVVPPVPPLDAERPVDGPFDLSAMVSAEHLDLNEILFFKAGEWDRMFAWCSFLEQRDGAYELYSPLVLTLRRALSGLTPDPDGRPAAA